MPHEQTAYVFDRRIFICSLIIPICSPPALIPTCMVSMSRQMQDKLDLICSTLMLLMCCSNSKMTVGWNTESTFKIISGIRTKFMQPCLKNFENAHISKYSHTHFYRLLLKETKVDRFISNGSKIGGFINSNGPNTVGLKYKPLLHALQSTCHWGATVMIPTVVPWPWSPPDVYTFSPHSCLCAFTSVQRACHEDGVIHVLGGWRWSHRVSHWIC